MKLTIITITYNDLGGLKRTVTSVESQTDKNFEFLVVDGASSDGTQAYLDSKELSYSSEKDTGIYNAMNKGLSRACGEFLVFLNAGDVFYNDAVVESFYKFIETKTMQSNADIYYGDALYVNDHKSYVHEADHRLIMNKMPFNHQSCFIRRSLHLKLLYNELYSISSDYAFFLKAHALGSKFEKLNFIVARHSLDGISVTNPFLSCLESVHAQVKVFKKIELPKTEYYGEFFINEIFKRNRFFLKLVIFLYKIMKKRV